MKKVTICHRCVVHAETDDRSVGKEYVYRWPINNRYGSVPVAETID